jgi:hypothetical protein
VNFFCPTQVEADTVSGVSYTRHEMARFKPPTLPMPKAPNIASNASSFLWAVGLGLYIFLGGLSVALASPEVTLIVSVVAGCAIFAFVRLYGEDDPNRP